jgi:hypothetical protein
MKHLFFLVAAFGAMSAFAQTPPLPAPGSAEPNARKDSPLAPLAWLEGCWHGTAGRREFREHWMPPEGGLLLGMSHMVENGKTISYEYLRIEPRPDGVYYLIGPAGKTEAAYRFAEQTADRTEGRNDEIFTFVHTGPAFPQRIVYRRAAEGWLYAAVEGKVGTADRQVTYPMRRVDCESGEFLRR